MTGLDPHNDSVIGSNSTSSGGGGGSSRSSGSGNTPSPVKRKKKEKPVELTPEQECFAEAHSIIATYEQRPLWRDLCGLYLELLFDDTPNAKGVRPTLSNPLYRIELYVQMAKLKLGEILDEIRDTRQSVYDVFALDAASPSEERKAVVAMSKAHTRTLSRRHSHTRTLSHSRTRPHTRTRPHVV